MSELGIAKEVDGMRFLIEKIENSIVYDCPPDCTSRQSYSSGCDTLKVFQIKENEKSFNALVITIVATNFACGRIGHVDYRDVIMVDSDGFTHKGILKCYNSKLPLSEWGDYYTEFLPQTKVRYKVMFPTLAEGLTVSKVIIRPLGNSRNTVTFNIEPYKESVLAELQPISEPSSTTKTTSNSINIERGQPVYPFSSDTYLLQNIQRQLRSLKVSIHSRLTNQLTEKEQINLENKIGTDSYALKLELDAQKDPQFEVIKNEFDKLLIDYKKRLVALFEASNNKINTDTKIEELYSLSPREFEEYTQQLLIHMGYENVVLTPYVNDKGIDLFCERNGEKIAVQCKKYKGTVGSPEIISFIGAMSNAHVDSGIFITTGMFSFEAESLAAKNPILLINRVRLAKIVIDLLDPAKSSSMDEPKTGQITIDYS